MITNTSFSFNKSKLTKYTKLRERSFYQKFSGFEREFGFSSSADTTLQSLEGKALVV